MPRPANAIELAPNRWGIPDGIYDDGEPRWQMLCKRCWQPRNASWNDGLCLNCYEEDLLPIPPEGLDDTGETWEDIYVGRNYLDD